MVNTTIQGFDEFVQLRDIQDELGINGDKLNELIQNVSPNIYEQWLYGCRYIRLEDYKRIEADFLKNRHKQAALRQAILLNSIEIPHCIMRTTQKYRKL